MNQNVPASIRQRLLNLAKERGEDFNYVLKLFLIQRILYRLGISDYKNKYTLKGAMLFWVWGEDSHRPTRDIDLLGYGSNDIEALVNDFRQICQLECEDGLIFDLDSINGEEIKEDAKYQGVRVKGSAALSGAKITFQIDIGFGDAVTPGPETASMKSFLDLPTPELKVYPVYTVIAEKFQAMVQLDIANSRIKDFYDIWIIASKLGKEIDSRPLAEAIRATFQRRETSLTPEITILSTMAGSDAKEQQWQAFLSKNDLESEMRFGELLEKLSAFLQPVYEGLTSGKEIVGYWSSENWAWNLASDEQHP